MTVQVEQLLCIMEVQDVPPARMLEMSTRKKHFFDSNGNPRIIPNAKGKKRRPGTKVRSASCPVRCQSV